MSNLFFVQATRNRMGQPRAPRSCDLVGPFDSWLAASNYANAWRKLWRAERAKAHVVQPLAPCVAVTDWERSIDEGAADSRANGRCHVASEARETAFDAAGFRDGLAAEHELGERNRLAHNAANQLAHFRG